MELHHINGKIFYKRYIDFKLVSTYCNDVSCFYYQTETNTIFLQKGQVLPAKIIFIRSDYNYRRLLYQQKEYDFKLVIKIRKRPGKTLSFS